MKAKTIVLNLIVFLGISLVGSRGGAFYVSANGSDLNPGTSTQPFRTITYAYSQATAGTTILAAPGTHTNYIQTDTLPKLDPLFIFTPPKLISKFCKENP